MTKYAILQNPGRSWVYFEASKTLAVAELTLAGKWLSQALVQIQTEKIAGIDYLTFTVETALVKSDIAVLSRLSFFYALFENREDVFIPIEKAAYEFIDPKISMILKYTGKTNEDFTRMMINAAAFSSDFMQEPELSLLDPIAGKGTTLYEGLVLGYDVAGIEIGEKVVHDAALYLKKYLETERYKHLFHKQGFGGENKSFHAEMYVFDLSQTKTSPVKSVKMIAGNTIYADKFYKKESFHFIVGDLPYGVLHGNVTNEKQSSLTRNPSELLEACLPQWYTVLKKGGILTLAWNTFLLSREKLQTIVERHGFTVFQEEPYLKFEHRVDQAIKRDILVAKKG